MDRSPGGTQAEPGRLIALVGLGAVLPKARNVAEFWTNVLGRRDCISEVPRDRWDPDVFYDPDPDAEDKTVCKRGGFVDEIPFDSRAFKIAPLTARAMDRFQKMVLVAAAEAMRDAGYDRRPFDRSRTAVIIGNASGHTDMGFTYRRRLQVPLLERATRAELEAQGVEPERIARVVSDLRAEILHGTVPFTEDSFPGVLVNVAAGRVASHFDLHGPSYVVDSACATSLAAIECAAEGLAAHEFDMAITGAGHAWLDPNIFVLFSKFRGLSPDAVKPFDAAADGFVLGEGAALFVLKRLADARRDGDRIYAVLRGIGSSSDGRDKGIAAPNPKTQALAIRRALERAGYGPETVQYVETHGTGTPVGDPVEIEALNAVFGNGAGGGRRIALGAVKSQIGHLMGGAGAAGLLKTVLGLHHNVLPPTIRHDRPSAAIPWTDVPFRVVTSSAPWPANPEGLPRRAGVSAFGFGGTNFHAAVEAYDEAYHDALLARPAPAPAAGEPIAIIGLGAGLPDAPDVDGFWRNVVGRVDSIADVPPERWDGRPEDFFDPDPEAPDKTYTKRGAFLKKTILDPKRFRLAPTSVQQLDPEQALFLAVADAALRHSGCERRAFDGARTAVVFGNAIGSDESAWRAAVRANARLLERTLASLPEARAMGWEPSRINDMAARVRERIIQDRPRFTEETALSLGGTIGPARFAKALDITGPHLTVDAACATSLAAIAVAVQGLRAKKWDMAIAGGGNRTHGPMLYTLMSKCRAVSATGTRPFDANADGVAFGEGVVLFVLKRLRDALADGDTIHAVVRGIGLSSDGRGHAMAAPSPDGQALAMRRAYENAGYRPDTVQLVECHATSTQAGDASELAALSSVFDAPTLRGRRIGIGSVKSQIGHTIGAAGAAGLLKATLALHHKTLPPTINVREPMAALRAPDCPFYLVTEPQPWPENEAGVPRRAAVSAFGFGGTNAHVTLEEFVPAYHRALVGLGEPRAAAPACAASTESELVVVGGDSLEQVLVGANALAARAGRGGDFAALAREGRGAALQAAHRLALCAEGRADLNEKLDLAQTWLRPGKRSPILDTRGIYYGNGRPGPAKIAFLFPGQGSQYADMLHDLYDRYVVVRETFAEANTTLVELLGAPLEDLIFVGSRAGAAEEAEGRLLWSDVVQPALVASNIALFRLLGQFGLEPDVVAGHSLGEYSALVAGGVLDLGQAVRAAHVRGREFRRLSERAEDAGTMAMVSLPAPEVARALDGVKGYVTIANRNCSVQTVISGQSGSVQEVVRRLEADGVECRVLPIAGAFHSEIAGVIRAPLAAALARLDVRSPRLAVLSSVDGAYYPMDATCRERVTRNLLDQLHTPVDFVGLVERLHADGGRTFVEVGPKRALSTFVSDILAGKPHVSLHSNHPKVGGRNQLNRMLAQLAAAGSVLDIDGPDRNRGAAEPAPAGVAATERIVFSGAAVGLPGKAHPVFADDSFARLFAGQSLIDPIPEERQDRIVEKRVMRLVKPEDGETRFEEVADRAGTIKLAGQRGRFDLREEYGIDDDGLAGADSSYRLAVAAGIEALRDAGIPLQRTYRKASTGTMLAGGWALPESLRDETAVIFASAYPGLGKVIDEVAAFYDDKYGALAADAIRAEYLRRLGEATDARERRAADEWFLEARSAVGRSTATGYRFSGGFVKDFLCMGNTRFAELVKARGPNFHVNAACASATVAVALAEDLLRSGRARRVIVLAADDATSDTMLEWIGAGFLAAGAAATDGAVADAALPFDRRRHGLVLGMGASALVLEVESAVAARGMEGIAELLGAHVANSAYHATRLDSGHVAGEMARFVERMERRHGLRRAALAPQLQFMSHETFTPARGGSAQSEVQALREAFGPAWRAITVANTKGLTGHAQGAGIEDVVALKALQLGQLPPVANHRDEDPELDGIKLSRGGASECAYTLRFAAGFGSQMAMFLARVVSRDPVRIADRAGYERWLTAVTGIEGATLEVVNRTLRVRDVGAPVERGAASPSGPAAPVPVAAAEVSARTAPASAPAAAPAAPAVPAPAPAEGGAEEAIRDEVLAIVAEKTGYEREMLELDLDLEADLGIDTIKQAQVLGQLRERYCFPRDEGLKIKDYPTLRHVIAYIAGRLGGAGAGAPVSSAAAPASASVPRPAPAPALPMPVSATALGVAAVPASAPAEAAAEEAIRDEVLAIVAEKTGYEREMLELDLDLEADLGIDTIKQAQVLGQLRERYCFPRDEGLKIKDYPTLRHVIAYIAGRLGGAEPAPVSLAAAPPARRATMLSESLAPLEARLASDAVARPAAGRDLVREYLSADELREHASLAGAAATRWLEVRIAAKELASRLEGVRSTDVILRPAGEGALVATTAHRPLNGRRLTVSHDERGTHVAATPTATLDLEPVVTHTRQLVGCADWLGEHLIFGMIHKFLREVRIQDPAAYAAIRGRPAIYLSNHETAIESILFGTVISALGGSRLVHLAKREHGLTWVGALLGAALSYPGARGIEGLVHFVNRADQDDMLRILKELECALRESQSSVHLAVEGTREAAARHRVQKLSSVWLDLALELGCAIVPTRFLGGLPVEDTGLKYELPVGFGSQTVILGRPISPEDLARMPPRTRRDAILGAINVLGPPEDESPDPPDEAFAEQVRAWMEYSGVDEMPAVMFRALERFRPLDVLELREGVCAYEHPTDALLAAGRLGIGLRKPVALVLPETPEGMWLRPVVAWLCGARGPQACSPGAAPASVPVTVVAGRARPAAERIAVPPGIRRAVVETAECPLDPGAEARDVGAGWTVILTDDGAGVARALARRLAANGARTALLTRGAEGPGTYACALDSAEDVRRALTAVRGDLGSVHGLVHLSRLDDHATPEGLDPDRWRTLLAWTVKGFFYLAKELREDLVAAGQVPGGNGAHRGALLVAVTWLGGSFGLDPDGAAPARPGDGGVAGLAKALAKELPDVRAKTIDLEPPRTPEAADDAAALILSEIERGGARVETGYRRRPGRPGEELSPSSPRRLVPSVVARPVDVARPPAIEIDPSTVIALLGGARGITAEIAKDLATRFQPTLVLVGATRLPADVGRLAAIDDEGLRQMRQRTAREIKDAGGRGTPVEVQARLEPLLRAIEAHRTLGEVQARGARAAYHACDVRDARAVEALFAEIRRVYGRLDGVVFAPGTIEDKRLEDKTTASFDRVFGVKAEGIFHVARALEPFDLAFFAAFSSVAGRFGNAGQTDYAAANDLLNKFVLHLRTRRPRTRWFSLDWTAWGRVGLAARSGVAEVMAERGFRVLAPEEGAALFRQELLFGGDAPEVVLAGSLGPLDVDGIVTDAPPAALPLDRHRQPILDEIVEHERGVALVARRTVDPARDPWLLDHVIGGVPLVPGVLGVELMVEAAASLLPDWHFAAVEDARFHLAVKILRGRPVELRVRACVLDAASAEERRVGVVVESDFVNDAGATLVRDRRHYESTVVVTRRRPLPRRAAPPAVRLDGAGLQAVTSLYGAGRLLSHGPRFQVLHELRLVDGEEAVGLMAAMDERAALAVPEGSVLATAPLAREAAFQTAVLSHALRGGTVGLPHGIHRIEHFGVPPTGVALVARVFTVRGPGDAPEFRTEIVGDDGLVYDRMEGFYTVSPDTLSG